MCAMQAETTTLGSVPLQCEFMDNQLTTNQLTGDEVQNNEVASVPGIDDLPDEILLEIFSQITDGFCLLKTLPAVSQRWRAVSSDRAAWRGVTLCAKAYTSIPSVERVLLERAPAVENLHISLFLWPSDRRVLPDRRFVRALSRLLVYQTLTIEVEPPKWLRKAYLEVVWRSRCHLKRLSFALDGTTKTGLGHSSVYVLAHLPYLEDLTLYVDSDFVYEKGQLQLGLPNLKTIHVIEKETSRRQHDLIRDLLVVGLERAKFRPSFPPTPDLLTALAKCQKLTDLVIHWDFSPVFRRLPSLKSVHVNLSFDNPLRIHEIERAFVAVYTPTLNDIHVFVACKNCQGRQRALDRACQRGVEAVEKLGFDGTITYLVWQHFST